MPAGLSPAEPRSKVLVSAWGRLSAAAPEAFLDDKGAGVRGLRERQLRQAAVGARGGGPVSWQRVPSSGRALPAWVGLSLPSPAEAPRSPGPGDPRQSPGVAWGARPGGGAGVGVGDPGRPQLPAAVSPTPAGLRGGAGTRRARGGTTSLFPPGPRRLGLKRVFPVGLPNPGRRAQPPGTRPESCLTPPRPGARPGGEGEAGEPGRWVPGELRAFHRPAPTPYRPPPDPVGPQGHPNRGFWKSFLSESANQSSRPTLLLYLGKPRHKQIVPRPHDELANHRGA